MDGIRRQGKGRCVCLGGRICSIPCRAGCFALVYLKEKVEFILFFLIDRGKKLARQGIEHVFGPQTDATTFALSSNSILLLWSGGCRGARSTWLAWGRPAGRSCPHSPQSRGCYSSVHIKIFSVSLITMTLNLTFTSN